MPKANSIRYGERVGTHGPECRGSYQRVKLRTREQIYREYECSACGRTLRVRVSERTGEATVPRHRQEAGGAMLGEGDIVTGPACGVCGSDLWEILPDGRLRCYGTTADGDACKATREVRP